MPSILKQGSKNGKIFKRVLNLIITGMPSIQNCIPFYMTEAEIVLNLIITGMPSILTGVNRDFDMAKETF